MGLSLVAAVSSAALLAGAGLFGAADAHGSDGDAKAVARWAASQAVSPQGDIDSALALAKEQVCGDPASHECGIGGTAIDGAGLKMGLSGLAAVVTATAAAARVILR